MATPDANAKRHKHKHKCGDELCKHRKHKKRRKHKKHHHREVNPLFESPETASKDEDNDIDVAEPVEITAEKLIADNKHLTKGVNIKLNKLQWPLDEDLVSSITEESSGSSYVSP